MALLQVLAVDKIDDLWRSTTAPWWAVVLPPILTFILGQWFTNQGNEKRATQDAAIRQAERDDALKIEQVRRDTELEKLRAQLESDREERIAEAREKAVVEALDATAEMRAFVLANAQATMFPSGSTTLPTFAGAIRRVGLYLYSADVIQQADDALAQVSTFWSIRGQISPVALVGRLDSLVDALVFAYQQEQD